MGSFTPADLTGLRFWLDATDASTITVNDQNQVTSMSEKGLNATLTPPAADQRPTLVSNGIGGLPSLSFSSTSADGLLSDTKLDFMHQGVPFSLFMVLEPVLVTDHRQMLLHTGAWSGTATGFYVALDSTATTDFYRSNMRNNTGQQMVAVQSTNTTPSTDPTVLQYSYNYSDPANSAFIYEFGDLTGSNTSSTNAPSGGTSSSFPQIGYLTGQENRAFSGLISEMIIVEGALTEEQVGQIGYYLSQKYDIQTSYVPEPRAMALMAGIVTLLVAFKLRRRRSL